MPDNPLLTLILSFIGAGGGAYFGAYLKKKGENLATHEDLDRLVNQVATVTKTTKEIEAKISNDVWERQKRWEVKKDAVFEVVKETDSIIYGLVQLNSVCGPPSAHLQPMLSEAEAKDYWNKALLTFQKARVLAVLVSNEPLRNALDAFHKIVVESSNGIVSDSRIRAALDTIYFEARKELDLNPPILQSRGSSAVQAPTQ